MNLNKKIDLEFIRNLSREKNEPEWMLKKRMDAFKMFNETSMPEFNYGSNITLNYDFDFQNIKKEKSFSEITTLNKNKKLIFETFDSAFKKEEKIMKEYLLKLIPDTKFNLLNISLLDNGFLIYIPENIKIKTPIKISSLLNGDSLFQHILIDEDLSIKDKYIKYFSKIIEIYQKENSELNYFNIQNLNDNVYNYSYKKSDLKKSAVLNFYDFNIGSKLTYSQILNELNEEYSNANYYNLFFGKEEQQFDISIKNNHNSKNTNSNILGKGILLNNSKGIYQGLIKINKDALYSNGFQKEEILLINENAEADSIPILEIDNSEVNCKHATTISHLDKDRLFYLMSRGINEDIAKNELIKGFFNSLFINLSPEEKEILKKMIEDKLK
jgi:Fe-S cluster assembly protein SufD